MYDLDKKNPRMVHLIEPLHKEDANRTLLMMVDIDRSVTTLTFNLLLTTNIMRGMCPSILGRSYSLTFYRCIKTSSPCSCIQSTVEGSR